MPYVPITYYLSFLTDPPVVTPDPYPLFKYYFILSSSSSHSSTSLSFSHSFYFLSFSLFSNSINGKHNWAFSLESFVPVESQPWNWWNLLFRSITVFSIISTEDWRYWLIVKYGGWFLEVREIFSGRTMRKCGSGEAVLEEIGWYSNNSEGWRRWSNVYG